MYSLSTSVVNFARDLPLCVLYFLQKELVETGVCTESRAKTVVEEFMIPLVGGRQRIYEQNLETMEVSCVTALLL